MRRILFIPIFLLLLSSISTACSSEEDSVEEWSEELYTSQWQTNVDWCNERRVYLSDETSKSPMDLKAGKNNFGFGYVLTIDERNEIGASNWFLSSDWSKLRNSHEWKEMEEFWFDRPSEARDKYRLSFNSCLKYLRDRGVYPEEFFRCVWDEIEIKHKEKDWRYYPPQVKETHENSAHEFCLSKYPWSSK